MIYEGVNFNAEEVRKMTPEEFESRHLPLFWRDRNEETRKKMLGQVYELIAGKPARQNKRKEEEQ